MNEEVKEQEEKPDSYFIPDNFTDSGRILNGMFETRKLLEAVGIGAVLYFIEKNLIYLPMENKAVAVLIMLCTISPIVIMALIGLNGDCLSVFIKTVFTFIKDKRKLRFRRVKKNVETSNKKHGSFGRK